MLARMDQTDSKTVRELLGSKSPIDQECGLRLATPPSKPIFRYVALGDSFSSGEGVVNFDSTDTGTFTGPAGKPFFCHRSEHAYARIFAKDEGITSVRLYACSGARTEDFGKSQRGLTEPQLSHLGPSTSLITLTVGGNDLGFAAVLKRCARTFHCQRRYPNMTETIEGFAQALTDLYERIGASAPHAQIFALGYPQLFGTKRFCRTPFDRSERLWLRGLTATLDATIEKATTVARDQGTRVHYVSVLHTFDDHELCSTGSSYMNRLRIRNIQHSYHPNRLGQLALAHALEANYPSD
jgi:lysophospholipase L1-like esterase